MIYERTFLFALLLTLLIEIPVVFIGIKFFYKQKVIKNEKIILAGLIASVLTLPYFWFVMPSYISSRGVYIFLGESLIILIEAIIYNQLLKLKFFKAFIISLSANIASILLGLMVL